MAVRLSSSAAYWPVSPIRERTRCASRTTSWPSTLAEPPSGRSRVARIRTVVVLPAPLGPSRASTLPAGTARSTPASARWVPRVLLSPVVRTAYGSATGVSYGRGVRFAFALLGSRGDVQPALAVALELRGRGHEVEVAVAPNLVEFVARLGVPAVPVGGDSRDLLGSGLVREDMRSRLPVRRLRALRAVASVGWDDLRAGLVPLAARADVVVTGLLGQEVGAAVAEAHDVRFAALHYCPVRANPVVPLLDLPAGCPAPLARSVQAGAWRAGESARWWLTRRAENEQRARLGLAEARVGLPERLRTRGALEVQAYDPALVPGLAAAWPARRPVVGFLDLGAQERRRLADTDVAEDPALEDWLAAGTAPIYVGFGSMAVGDPRQLVATVQAAAAVAGRAGAAQHRLERLPARAGRRPPAGAHRRCRRPRHPAAALPGGGAPRWRRHDRGRAARRTARGRRLVQRRPADLGATAARPRCRGGGAVPRPGRHDG